MRLNIPVLQTYRINFVNRFTIKLMIRQSFWTTCRFHKYIYIRHVNG